MNPETTPQRLMSFSSPLDRLVFIVAVSPATSTSMMLSYQDVLKSGMPKMSARYFLMARERESSVLANTNGVKNSVDMKTMMIEEINRRQMCFMFALLWIVVGRHTGKILDCRL